MHTMKKSAFIRIYIIVGLVMVQMYAAQTFGAPKDAALQIEQDSAENPAQSASNSPAPGLLYASDFASLAEGDFPPELEYREGGMQIDNGQGEAMLRFAGGSWFHIPLAATLSDSFVIEFDYYTSELYAVLFVSPFDAAVSGAELPSFSGYRQGMFNFFTLANSTVGAAVDRASESLPRANAQNNAFTEGVVPVRLEVKGKQAKIFVDGSQVVILPSATIHRTDVIEFFYASMGAPGNGYVGNIRIRGL